jgi:hypothetical protein
MEVLNFINLFGQGNGHGHGHEKYSGKGMGMYTGTKNKFLNLFVYKFISGKILRAIAVDQFS